MHISKIPVTLILLGLALIISISILLPTKQIVHAQCKSLSQCKDCHENRAQKPVAASGQWHIDHAAYDFCLACHAGNADATDATAAHAEVQTALAQMPGGCKTCHAEDLQAKYSKYATALNISIKIDPNAGVKGGVQKSLGTFLGKAAPANVPQANAPSAANTTPKDNSKPQNPLVNWILTGSLLLTVSGGGYYILHNERRLGNPLLPSGVSSVIKYLRLASWSPYTAGVLLGLICVLSVLLARRTLGASTGIATLASTLVTAAEPAVAAKSMYFKFIIPPGLNFEVLLLAGMFLGGMISAVAAGTFRIRWNDDPTWVKIFGPESGKRLLFGFIGTLFLQFGAGIAGGCTSGLAISGGMLLAPSAFIFMAGMFASGIIVALIVYRKRF